MNYWKELFRDLATVITGVPLDTPTKQPAATHEAKLRKRIERVSQDVALLELRTAVAQLKQTTKEACIKLDERKSSSEK